MHLSHLRYPNRVFNLNLALKLANFATLYPLSAQSSCWLVHVVLPLEMHYYCNIFKIILIFWSLGTTINHRDGEAMHSVEDSQKNISHSQVFVATVLRSLSPDNCCIVSDHVWWFWMRSKYYMYDAGYQWPHHWCWSSSQTILLQQPRLCFTIYLLNTSPSSQSCVTKIMD